MCDFAVDVASVARRHHLDPATVFRAFPRLANLQADGLLERGGVTRCVSHLMPVTWSGRLPRRSTPVFEAARPHHQPRGVARFGGPRVGIHFATALIRQLPIDRRQCRRQPPDVADDGVSTARRTGSEVSLCGGVDGDAEHGHAKPARFAHGFPRCPRPRTALHNDRRRSACRR